MPSKSTQPGRIRVLVVEDHPVTRRGLTMLLEGYDSVSVVAEAATASEALQVMHDFAADFVILDISLPDLNGIDLIEELKTGFPGTKVLMLSSSKQATDISRAFAAGASGFCHKDEEMEHSLHQALRFLRSGEYWLDSNSAQQLGLSCEFPASQRDLLNGSELQLLKDIAARRSDVCQSHHQTTMAGIVAKLRDRRAA